MKTSIYSFGFLVAVLGGCLFNGEGTEGLPCNTDTECGGTQQCIEHVCGGPTVVATDVSIGGSSDESDSSGDEAPMETNDDDVRTECEASETQCLDENTLRMCTEDGKLSTRDCNGWCGQGAENNGCWTDPAGVDTCWCLGSAQPCTDEGAEHCDGDNYTHCVDGWAYPTDCDTQCIQDGYSAGVSHCEESGGEVTCICWSDGACEDGAARCLDNDTMQECVGGTWQNYDCFTDITCPDGTYSRGCTYLGGDTESCACWEL